MNREQQFENARDMDGAMGMGKTVTGDFGAKHKLYSSQKQLQQVV